MGRIFASEIRGTYFRKGLFIYLHFFFCGGGGLLLEFCGICFSTGISQQNDKINTTYHLKDIYTTSKSLHCFYKKIATKINLNNASQKRLLLQQIFETLFLQHFFIYITKIAKVK